MAIGAITRGTTGTNRLRRVDRYLATRPEVLLPAHPLVVDLGFGASAVTPLELHSRLHRVNAGVEVVGVEIDPARVETANRQLDAVRKGLTSFAADAAVSFAHGGFETPLPGGRRPTLIRAFNVLRQYDEADVVGAWRVMVDRLAPGGMLVEGTCDEIGRVSTWIDVDTTGPQRLTISLRAASLDKPSIAAERLPKALIHRNVDGERIHALMDDLDRGWRNNAALAVYGPTQRFIATIRSLEDAGWPVASTRNGVRAASRRRLGEFTVPWSAVVPNGFVW